MGYVVNLVLEGKPAVVVGGGEVAGRKVQDLLNAKARVTVIAPSTCPLIDELAAQAQIHIHRREFHSGDLRDAAVVIAATDHEDINAVIAREAAEQRVLVNVVDRPALCTFTVPATVCRGDLTIAVATEGRCPALAAILREELEQRYPGEYAGLVDLFAALRSKMMALGWDGPRIRETLAALYRGGVMRWIEEKDEDRMKKFLAERLDETLL